MVPVATGMANQYGNSGYGLRESPTCLPGAIGAKNEQRMTVTVTLGAYVSEVQRLNRKTWKAGTLSLSYPRLGLNTLVVARGVNRANQLVDIATESGVFPQKSGY